MREISLSPEKLLASNLAQLHTDLVSRYCDRAFLVLLQDLANLPRVAALHKYGINSVFSHLIVNEQIQSVTFYNRLLRRLRAMAEVLIEDLDSVLLQKLEMLAKLHGRSLQAELKSILEAAVQNTVTKTPEELGWSPSFFERTAGQWEGEPLTRGEQGEYEQRLWELL